MTDLAAVELIVQKDAGDCGIAALSMLLGKPYVDVAQIAHSLYPQCDKRGLWNTQLTRIAKKCGVVLKVLRPAPEVTEATTGILDVQKPKQGHYVTVFQGVILNPADGLIWDWEAFVARGKWRPKALIVKAE